MTAISPLAVADDFHLALDGLLQGANEELLAVFNYAKSSGNWGEFARTLRVEYPKIYAQYSAMGTTLGSAYYETLRANALAGSTTTAGSYTATRASVSAQTLSRGSEGASYALSLAYRGFPDSSVKSALAGYNNYAVTQGAFESIIENSYNDSFAAEYKRIPSSTACTFCLEVGSATGEDFEEGWDSKFHTHCKCVVIATFENQKDLDLRRQNLREYESKRDEAIEAIRAGEFSETERVVPRNSEEYRSYVNRELRSNASRYRKNAYEDIRDEKGRAPTNEERIAIRKQTNEDIERLIPAISKGEPLEQDSEVYNILDKYMDPESFKNPLHKPIDTVSHKDLLWVMRNKYGFK